MDWTQIVGGFAGGGGLTAMLTYLTRKRRDKLRDAKRFDEITLAVYDKVAEAQKKLMADLQREVSELRVEMGSLEVSNEKLVIRIADLEKRNRSLSNENRGLKKRVLELERELALLNKAEGADGF